MSSIKCICIQRDGGKLRAPRNAFGAFNSTAAETIKTNVPCRTATVAFIVTVIGVLDPSTHAVAAAPVSFWISIKCRKSRLVLDRRRRSSSFTIRRLNDLHLKHTHARYLHWILSEYIRTPLFGW